MLKFKKNIKFVYQHALLAITLGVKKIIIAVNKMDDETVNWDQTRYSAIAAKVSAFLRSCGYKPKDVCSLPLSALGGDLLCAAAPAAAWYGGEPLFDLLDQQRVAFSARPELRVPVVERYRDMGVVVATGKIISGRVSVGDALVVMPHGVEVFFCFMPN